MITAIVQARMTSSRLPGKVLMPILGKPMLGRQIDRIKHSRLIEKIVVATSDHNSDDPIHDFAVSGGIECFRGDLDDVLARYYFAAKSAKATSVVRLTGDCPLADPKVIDSLVKLYSDGDYDYVSNTLTPTFPDGLDAEVFSREALETAFHSAQLPSEREHVTPYIKNSAGNTVLNVTHETNLSSLRWTVDEPEDFDLVSRIFSELYPLKPDFEMADVLDVLEKHPEWSLLNDAFRRDEGYLRSLEEDARLLSTRNSRTVEP
jgi:spore coat polysaccharide biosynthesis protein SpsF